MITAQNIHVSYDNVEVLHGIDLSVNDGEFLSIMGKSGSGKSTLLNVLAGNIVPDKGSVSIDGEDISHMKPANLAKMRRTKLGFVYQSLNLIPTLNARDNILLPIYLDRKSPSEAARHLDELAEYLEIKKVVMKFPSEMSGGERQRVAIAKALIHSPSIIMLDEPTGSLDSGNSLKIMDLLLKINREMGVSIIQVTHNPENAAVGDRVAEIIDGQIKAV